MSRKKESLGRREIELDGVKIVVIAHRLGVTSGSFYWHFMGLASPAA